MRICKICGNPVSEREAAVNRGFHERCMYPPKPGPAEDPDDAEFEDWATMSILKNLPGSKDWSNASSHRRPRTNKTTDGTVREVHVGAAGEGT